MWRRVERCPSLNSRWDTRLLLDRWTVECRTMGFCAARSFQRLLMVKKVLWFVQEGKLKDEPCNPKRFLILCFWVKHSMHLLHLVEMCFLCEQIISMPHGLEWTCRICGSQVLCTNACFRTLSIISSQCLYINGGVLKMWTLHNEIDIWKSSLKYECSKNNWVIIFVYACYSIMYFDYTLLCWTKHKATGKSIDVYPNFISSWTPLIRNFLSMSIKSQAVDGFKLIYVKSSALSARRAEISHRMCLWAQTLSTITARSAHLVLQCHFQTNV